MASFTKEAKQLLKDVIKSKVQEQKTLKPQRKTVHFTGIRTVEPWQATSLHQINRYDLRHLYIAYGIMRGRTNNQIENRSYQPFNEAKVQQILDCYATKEVVCSE